MDPARTLVYRGAVSDQYGLGYALEAPRREFLMGALDASAERPGPSVTRWATFSAPVVPDSRYGRQECLPHGSVRGPGRGEENVALGLKPAQSGRV